MRKIQLLLSHLSCLENYQQHSVIFVVVLPPYRRHVEQAVNIICWCLQVNVINIWRAYNLNTLVPLHRFSLSFGSLPTMCIHNDFHHIGGGFVWNCRLCEKKRRETGGNWLWMRRKPFIVPVFVWRFLKLMLQLVNGNLSSELHVYLYPLEFGLWSWRNCLVRKSYYWILLIIFEPINNYYDTVLGSGICKFKCCLGYEFFYLWLFHYVSLLSCILSVLVVIFLLYCWSTEYTFLYVWHQVINC